MIEVMTVAERAAVHHALADPARLAIVEALHIGDRAPGELRDLIAADWNLLAFHLGVLEDAGLVTRTASEGDRRRRYVRLHPERLDHLLPEPSLPPVRRPLFVCTHNSARSPFAAAYWRSVSGKPADSAGSQPAPAVHPLAVTVARRFDIDLRPARPQAYDAVRARPDLLVSVCDRALEADPPFDAPAIHWSVPDPARGDAAAFAAAFDDIAARVRRLARSAA